MKINFIRIITVISITVLLSGCKSQSYYMARAVEKARKFTLRRTRDLPEPQRDYIRYAQPLLMEAPVFLREKDAGQESTHNIVQTCIVWKVPGLDYDIAVFGVSTRRMSDWAPRQLLRKRFVPQDPARKRAEALAIKYAQNNMLYLSNAERNLIRFAPPAPAITDFPLFDEKIKFALKEKYEDYQNGTEQAEEDLSIMEKDGKDLFVQSSFIWETKRPGKYAVITGLGGTDFAGWLPVSAVLRDKEGLEKHKLKRESKIIEAREYITARLPRLSGTLVYTIRSEIPEILLTDFKLKNPAGQKELQQISMVWPTEYKNEKAVISGFGTMDFSEWKPVDVYYKTDDELKKHNVTKNSAIEKAKKYALSEVAGLSETAKDNIKNKSPYILWTDYPVGFEYEEKPGKIEQRSFVWKTGKKGVLVIVSGIGMPTLEGWLPARVALETRESLLNHNTHIRKAIELSRTFARENPEKLTYKEEQTILTTRPRIYETDFDLKQIREDTTGHKSTYIQKTDEIQWSMVWDSDEKDVDIVVSGKGNEDFSEWKPFIIFLTAEKEIERCILK